MKQQLKVLTEAVESCANDHENISFRTAQCRPILVRYLVRSHEHAQTSDANEDTLYAIEPSVIMSIVPGEITHQQLRPLVLGSHVNPAEEQTDGDGPGVEEHTRQESRIFVCFHHKEITFDVACGKDKVYRPSYPLQLESW